jgi:hypothetical protein
MNIVLLTIDYLFFIVRLHVKTWRMGFSLIRKGEGEKVVETGCWSENFQCILSMLPGILHNLA